MPGEVIVELKNGGIVSSKSYRSAKIKRLFSIISGKSSYLLLKSNKSVDQMTKDLKNDPNIAKISPNYIRKALIIPNDPDFGDQWGLYNTGQAVEDLSKPGSIVS